MTGATPLYGWPYPDNANTLKDAVKQVPQDLATAIENTIAALFAGGVPGAGWITLPWAANWATHGSLNGARYSKYGSRVYVDAYGTRSTSTHASGAVVATLPAGYRPVGGITTPVRPVLINAGGGFTLGYANVNGAGQIMVTGSAGAGITAGSALLMVFDFPTN